MHPKPKYANYAELSAAFKSGELDSSYFIMLDKGGADATLCRKWDDSLSDGENDKRADECRQLFQPEYYDHIYDLYTALGIHAEAC